MVEDAGTRGLSVNSFKTFVLSIFMLFTACAPTAVFNAQTARGTSIRISGTWEGELVLISTYYKDNFADSGNPKKRTTDKEVHGIKIVFENPDQSGSIRGSVTEYRNYSTGSKYSLYFDNFFAQGNPEEAFWSYSGTGRNLKPYKAEYVGGFNESAFVGSLITTNELEIVGQKPYPDYKFFQVSEYRVILSKTNQ
jgi:hypothetical protein